MVARNRTVKEDDATPVRTTFEGGEKMKGKNSQTTAVPNREPLAKAAHMIEQPEHGICLLRDAMALMDRVSTLLLLVESTGCLLAKMDTHPDHYGYGLTELATTCGHLIGEAEDKISDALAHYYEGEAA